MSRDEDGGVVGKQVIGLEGATQIRADNPFIVQGDQTVEVDKELERRGH